MDLMLLMVNSGLGNLPFETHQKVLNELYQRFWPDINKDDVAETELKNLLYNCANSTGAETIEFFHDMAQLRK
jgi:hypothetical protein